MACPSRIREAPPRAETRHDHLCEVRAIAKHRLKERIEIADDADVLSVVTALANTLEIP